MAIGVVDKEGSSSGAPTSRGGALVNVRRAICPVRLLLLLLSRLIILDSPGVLNTRGRDGRVSEVSENWVILCLVVGDASIHNFPMDRNSTISAGISAGTFQAFRSTLFTIRSSTSLHHRSTSVEGIIAT